VNSNMLCDWYSYCTVRFEVLLVTVCGSCYKGSRQALAFSPHGEAQCEQQHCGVKVIRHMQQLVRCSVGVRVHIWPITVCGTTSSICCCILGC
jgi:hypothetical protein